MKIRLLWISAVVLFIAGTLAASSYAVLDPETIVGMWKFDGRAVAKSNKKSAQSVSSVIIRDVDKQWLYPSINTTPFP